MIDHFRSDLFDDVVKRQLLTVDLLVDKKEPLGPIHKYLMDSTFKNVRWDVSNLNFLLKKYYRFQRVKRRYYFRIAFLKFFELSSSEFKKLKLGDKLLYLLKRFLYSDLTFWFKYRKLRFKMYLPSEIIDNNSNNYETELKPITVEEVITAISDNKEEINKEVPAPACAEEKLKEEKKDKDVKSDIPPGQIALELDNFFNSSSPTTAQEEIKA